MRRGPLIPPVPAHAEPAPNGESIRRVVVAAVEEVLQAADVLERPQGRRSDCWILDAAVALGARLGHSPIRYSRRLRWSTVAGAQRTAQRAVETEGCSAQGTFVNAGPAL